jgi:hypothetical protein
MAAVGMKYLTFAPITAGTAQSAITYGTGVVAEHAISGNITYNFDEQSLYGDDKLAEYFKGLTGYDIELGLTELDDALAVLLGIERAATATNITTYHMVADNTTSVGVGFVQTLIVNGAKSYVGYWFHKATFSINNENAQTKGESIEWQTPTLTGKGWGVELDASNGVQYRERQVFTTEAAALAWLKSKANIT